MKHSNIIDMHAHIFPEKIVTKAVGSIGEFYGIPMRAGGLAEDLLQRGQAAGISRFVVFSTATVPHQVQAINNFISGQVALHPEFTGFGTLHRDMEHPEEEIERICSLGLRGVKLHPDFQKFEIDDPKMDPIYAALEGRLPILFHTGDKRYPFSRPEKLARVARKFPRLQAIAAHFGGYSVWEDVYCYDGCDNVFFDTSSTLFCMPKEQARQLISHFGADRFFFGTDYPMWEPSEELERFFALDLGDDVNEKILWKNAQRFLQLS